MRTGVRVNLRMRFKCTVYRATQRLETNRRAIRSGKTGKIFMEKLGQQGWEALENGEERMGRRQRGVPSPPTTSALPSEPMSEKPPKQTKNKTERKEKKDKEIMCFTTRPEESFEVLNELVVDRGPSPYVSLLELFGRFIIILPSFTLHTYPDVLGCVTQVMIII